MLWKDQVLAPAPGNNLYTCSGVRVTSMEFGKTFLSSRKGKIDFFWIFIVNMWDGFGAWARTDTDPGHLDEVLS